MTGKTARPPYSRQLAAKANGAGKQVLLLEANGQVGGAAITREFADGYSVSACAHLLYNLQPSVRKDLKLNPALASDDMTTIALGDDDEHVRIRGATVTGGTADVNSDVGGGIYSFLDPIESLRYE